MNYPPNTEMWGRGRRVLHDADAKTVQYVMIVEGVDPNQPDTHIVTRYADPQVSKDIWINHFSVLHDPALFEIDPNSVSDKWPHAIFCEGSRVAHCKKPGRTGQILFIEGARLPSARHERQHYGRARIHWDIAHTMLGDNATSWVYLDQLVPA